jgi:hypothetical protein
MKNKRFSLLGFTLIITGLLACPIPGYFKFFNNSFIPISHTLEFKKENCELRIASAHPWFNSKKKIVIIPTTIKNISINETCRFSFSDLIIKSQTDTFVINIDKNKFEGEFLLKEESVTLSPSEEKQVTLYYISKNNYSRNSFKKSLGSDTLTLELKPNVCRLYMVGKWR